MKMPCVTYVEFPPEDLVQIQSCATLIMVLFPSPRDNDEHGRGWTGRDVDNMENIQPRFAWRRAE